MDQDEKAKRRDRRERKLGDKRDYAQERRMRQFIKDSSQKRKAA